MRSTALVAVALSLSCGDGGGSAPPDARIAAIDAGAGNPPQLWLAGINGSEINLELVDHGPPPPF
jgi:hypothetical protein